MEATVSGLVTALVETFADGLTDYEAWKNRRYLSNHYAGKGFSRTPCALTTTLSIAGPQIQETYDKAVTFVGPEFSSGDFHCRSMLWSQLSVLSDRVAGLHRAANSGTYSVVDLADATQVCEDVRRASLHALADQYQRIVSSRPVPRSLGFAKPKVHSSHSSLQQQQQRQQQQQQQQYQYQHQYSYSSPTERRPSSVLSIQREPSYSGRMPSPHLHAPPKHQMYPQHQKQPSYRRQSLQYPPPPQKQHSQPQWQQPHPIRGHPSPPTDDEEKMPTTTIRATVHHRQHSHLSNEPPSPPLTDHASDSCDSLVATASTGATSMTNKSHTSHPSLPSDRRRSKSSFAQFCTEAMALQSDSQRQTPRYGDCEDCGYKWHSADLLLQQAPDQRDALQLKEGFRLTARYLAKSHVSPDTFGCVMCATTGRSERYASVEDLRDHINAAHTKWQLLHDQDCRASSKLASDAFW